MDKWERRRDGEQRHRHKESAVTVAILLRKASDFYTKALHKILKQIQDQNRISENIRLRSLYPGSTTTHCLEPFLMIEELSVVIYPSVCC